MKDEVTRLLVPLATGLGAALAGASWWSVAVVVLVVVGLPCLMVIVLSRNPRTRRVESYVVTWVGSESPEEPPDTS